MPVRTGLRQWSQRAAWPGGFSGLMAAASMRWISWAVSGMRPFRVLRSLARADTHLPACCHVWLRAKHDRSLPSRARR
jgi:hypothetical protein